jgi:uncharacterized phage infection (PIP) family protein YhgE
MCTGQAYRDILLKVNLLSDCLLEEVYKPFLDSFSISDNKENQMEEMNEIVKKKQNREKRMTRLARQLSALLEAINEEAEKEIDISMDMDMLMETLMEALLEVFDYFANHFQDADFNKKISRMLTDLQETSEQIRKEYETAGLLPDEKERIFAGVDNAILEMYSLFTTPLFPEHIQARINRMSGMFGQIDVLKNRMVRIHDTHFALLDDMERIESKIDLAKQQYRDLLIELMEPEDTAAVDRLIRLNRFDDIQSGIDRITGEIRLCDASLDRLQDEATKLSVAIAQLRTSVR